MTRIMLNLKSKISPSQRLSRIEDVNHSSLLVITLLSLAIGERVLFDLGPNIEFITVSLLLATVYLGREKALWIVLITMVISDAILGNTNIFIFTWTGFLIPAYLASIHLNKLPETQGLYQSHPSDSTSLFTPPPERSLNKSKNSSIKLIGKSTLFGVGTGLFFFLWTNFGVWLLDSWGMYSNDVAGLMQSYVNALPFLRANIISNLVIVPAVFTSVESLKYIYKLLQHRHSGLDPGSTMSSSAKLCLYRS